MNSNGLVDHNSRPIAWREAGAGAAVVFLHGMPGSRTSWDDQISVLKEEYRCISWDMPGYGESDVLPVQSDFSAMVTSLRTFIERQLGLERAHLVGLSLGGMIALHAAIAGEGFVRSLSILDSSPCFGFGGGSDPKEFINSVIEGIRTSGSVDAFARSIVPSLVGPNCTTDRKDRAIASMSRATADGLEMAARLIARHDIRDKLGDVAVPTLVMTGEDDVDTPVAYGRFIAESIPEGRFVAVPAAGHISNIENPAFVNAQLRAFLSAL